MAFLTTPQPTAVELTLADLDADCDFDPLDKLISRYAGDNCLDFAFHDDNHKSGYRALEYDVKVLVGAEGHDWDDDMGYVGATSRITERVRVRVAAGQCIDDIARLIAIEIRGIDGNIHA